MKTPEAAIAWSFWRNSRPFVILAILISTMFWMLALKWPSVASSSFVFCICMAGWMISLRASTMITDHLMFLPVSTTRLRQVAYVYAFVLSGAFCLATCSAMNLLGAQWNLLETTFACSVLGVIVVAFACLFYVKGQEGFEALLVVFIGLMAVDALGLTPSPEMGRVEALHRLRWPIMMAAAGLAWLSAFYGIRLRRRTGESLTQRLLRFDFPLSKLWRPQFASPRSPRDAVLQLDWGRCYEGFLVAGCLSVFFVVLFSFCLDDSRVLMMWLILGLIVPLLAYFVMHSFSSYDAAKNGAFRWTLPVSDRELAFGMLTFLVQTLLAFWFMWVIGIAVLIVASWAQGRFLLDELEGLRRLGPTGYGTFLLMQATGCLLISWIGGSIGLVHNYVGRGRDVLLVLLVYASPITIRLWLEKMVPEAYWFLTVQVIGAVVGMWMMGRTWRMFCYARRAELFSRDQTWGLSILWLMLTVASAVPIIWYGWGVGVAILVAGIWALAFYPWAGLPFAVGAVRHWHSTSPG